MSAERLAKHPFWHAVGIGTTPYARLAFRIETIGAGGFRFEPGTLLTVTHRSDNDAPVMIAVLYRATRSWAERHQRLHFAARDDMFEPGFFAGMVPGPPPALRRLVYPIAIDRYLRMVRVHPVGSTRQMKLAQALARVDPGKPLPGSVARLLEPRAAELELPPPRTAGDALRGEYADLLWDDVGPDEFPVDEAWSRRGREARTHVETLVALLREREPLLLFPEGRPSPDGAVGPLRRGLKLLVRRGRPERISPRSIAYDPLVRGRPRAVVSARPDFEPDSRTIDERVLDELKLAMPLTCGSLVAHSLREGAATTDDLAAALDAAVEAARREGRPVERDVAEPTTRRRRLSECLSALKQRGVLATPDGRRLEADLSDRLLGRLAREYESARER